MGLVDSFIRSVGSLTIVDDFDDYSSSTDATVIDRKRLRAANGNAVRHRRPVTPPPPAQSAPPSFDDLRRENRALRQRQEKLEKEIARAKRHVDHYKERRREAEREKDKMGTRVKELEVTVENMKESYQTELDDVRAQLESTASSRPPRSQSPGTQPREQDELSKSRRSQTPFPSDAQTDRSDLARQLVEKDDEIRALRVYLDETDELSVTDVVNLVRDLNSEIASLTASIVDSVLFLKTFEFEQAWVLEAAEPYLSDCLQLLVGGGASSDFSNDPTLVQLALQAWTVYCCRTVFSRFCFGLTDEEDELLTRIFERLRRKESHAVAARWRVLSHTNVRHIHTRQERSQHNIFERTYSQESKSLERRILLGSERIILFAGARNPRGTLSTMLAESFGQRITSLIRMASDLAATLAEKFISTQLAPIAEEAGKPFDSLTMESVDADRSLERFRSADDDDDRLRRDTDASVMCTVGFGLQSMQRSKTPRPAVGAGAEESKAGSSGSGFSQVLVREVALKPKVLLSSTVKMMQMNTDA